MFTASKMSLPVVKRCCGCLAIETGCFLFCIVSILLCIGAIGVGSWKLPHHQDQRNEDNLILMSLVMFSTLSTISNLVALAGIKMRRASYLQLSFLTNCVFILCIFLVVVVTCLFSPGLWAYFDQPGYIALVVVLDVAGAVYALYYLTILNSMYGKLKMTYGDSAIPV